MQLPTDPHSGFLHSLEAGSAVDGPGIRLVLFMSGCLLRCQFCHNPDTWNPSAGKRVEAEELLSKIESYAQFLRTVGGGVTFTGGEPLYQAPFVFNVLAEIQRRFGLHTAIQTAGFLQDRVTDEQLSLVDLWMVDLKSADRDQYKLVTGVDQTNSLTLMRRLDRLQRPTWATYVLVPGLTDDERHLHQLGELLGPMKNIQRLELRPFHQLGREKWTALGINYPLASTSTPPPPQVERAAEIIKGHGVNVVVA
jgi:pyruvate formate lyase activating enzyme